MRLAGPFLGLAVRAVAFAVAFFAADFLAVAFLGRNAIVNSYVSNGPDIAASRATPSNAIKLCGKRGRDQGVTTTLAKRPARPLPASKVCRHCGKTFTRPTMNRDGRHRLRSTDKWRTQRFCTVECCIAYRLRDAPSPPWPPTARHLAHGPA